MSKINRSYPRTLSTDCSSDQRPASWGYHATDEPVRSWPILKTFVFLDLFDTEGTSLSVMALHPHSGIATLTYMIEGSVRYEDTSGATGILSEGGVEFFKAGHGAWHGGGPNGSDRSRGFQLWIALPPGALRRKA